MPLVAPLNAGVRCLIVVNEMSLAKKYKKSFDGHWCLRFKTRHPDNDAYDGVVTHITRDFIILREEVDFEFDGIIILPKKSIKGYRDSKYETCCNEILRENGAMKKCHSPRWLDSCETLSQVFAQMKSRDIWPGVETLFNEGKENAFYIGPITRTEDHYFYILCYDAAGKWEKEYQLTYEEVFRIELNSRYCDNFNAYMRRRDST